MWPGIPLRPRSTTYLHVGAPPIILVSSYHNINFTTGWCPRSMRCAPYATPFTPCVSYTTALCIRPQVVY